MTGIGEHKALNIRRYFVFSLDSFLLTIFFDRQKTTPTVVFTVLQQPVYAHSGLK
jgi:hypothetical protein